MLVVSARLLARRRAISSPMFTSASLETNFSSSIFASSSAIGCSKSRKFIAIRRHRCSHAKERANIAGAPHGRARSRRSGPITPNVSRCAASAAARPVDNGPAIPPAERICRCARVPFVCCALTARHCATALPSAAAHAGALADLEVYDRTSQSNAADPRARGAAVCRRRAAPSVRAAHPQSLRRALARRDQRRRRQRHQRRDGSTAAERLCARRLGLGRGSTAGARIWTKSPRSTSRACADSYAARTGRPHDVGVIGVALFREHRPHYACCRPWREDRALHPRLPEASAQAAKRLSVASATPVARASGAASRSSGRVTAIAKPRPRSTWTSSAPRRRPTKRS